MRSNQERLLDICDRWDREAAALEQMADQRSEYTDTDQQQLRTHARVKHQCANELRVEARRVRNG